MSNDTRPRFEDRLLDALLERHPARATPALNPARPAHRRTWGLALAGATGLAVAAGGLAGAGEFTHHPPGPAPSAPRLIYQAEAALSRVAPTDIEFSRQTTTYLSKHGPGGALTPNLIDVNLMWQHTAGHGKQFSYASRSEDLTIRPPHRAASPDDDASALAQDKAETGQVVNYARRVWWPYRHPHGFTSPKVPTTTHQIQDIRQQLRSGTFYVLGRVSLRGRPAIEIARRGQWVRIWLDPRTHLILQDEQRFRLDKDDVVHTVYQFRWLPPTAANLAQLVAPVPAGFRKIADQPHQDPDGGA
jgi:hypothetical protein